MQIADHLPLVLAPEERTEDGTLTINRIVRETPGIWAEPLARNERRALRDIADCRTPAMGGTRLRCSNCGDETHRYDSCRNRNCPSCLGHKSHEWLEQRAEELLPVPYFHVVFTVPEEVAKIARVNFAMVCHILFAATRETMLAVAADPKYLGARLGFMAILHTWSQRLTFHPHIHCVVPGGGLSAEGDTWVSSKPSFFLPVRVLSRRYRQVFLEKLEQSFEAGELKFPGAIETWGAEDEFRKLMAQLGEKDWVVYAKPPFGSPEQVLKYLARYTHRIAISNRRLVSFRDGWVTFRYRVSAETNRISTMTLDAVEFLRRLGQHVLPRGFKRIRYFGFMATNQRAKNLERCRALITAAGCAIAAPKVADEPVSDIEKGRCAKCGQGHMEPAAIIYGRAYLRELRRKATIGNVANTS